MPRVLTAGTITNNTAFPI